VRRSLPALLAAALFSVSAALLSGCARSEPAVQFGQMPRAEAAPDWLPTGWVRYDPRPQLAPERDLVQWYAPDGATAPLVVFCRYTSAEVAHLRAKQGPDVAGATLTKLAASFGIWPREVKGQGEWPRAGALRGRWIDVSAVEPDDRAGLLHGRLAVAETVSGALVVIGVLLPTGGDEALIEQVLSAAPLS